MTILKKISDLSIKPSLLIALGFSLVLSACSDNDNDLPTPPEPPVPAPKVYQYSVNVTNLTNAQPMSPVAVVFHNEGDFWQVGTSASVALETLAESGDNSAFMALSNVLASSSGAGVLMPGVSEEISLSIEETEPMMLSVATMLVNTNDAFTGVNAFSLTEMVVGESISLQTRSYDSGTEKNSELATTIPGPAGGGEGFNEARDDVDFVGMHAGVVSVGDGLTTSALTEAHRFDNPTLRIEITRVE